MQTRTCSNCQTRNQPAARYCRRCGQGFEEAAREPAASAPARHPTPLKPGPGFQPVEGMTDLYFEWHAAWGGAMLLGTETIAVVLFNGGYSLEEAVLRVRGFDTAKKCVFGLDIPVERLPRGKNVTIEIPSYEVSQPASALGVTLKSGRFASTA